MQSKNSLYSGIPYKKSLENEDSDDGYISPQDISIKDEKIWDPSDEEILSYALKLGYDIEKDPDELFEVAYYYMKYPLPDGWKRGIMKSTKELVYINFLSGEIEVSTEIEEMAHQMYLEKKSEMNQKNVSIFKKSPEKKGTTTVVPRKKIPPLNPLQKSNNSNGIKSLPGISNSNMKNKNNDNKNEDLFFSSDKKKEKELYNNKNNDLDIFQNENEKIIKLNNNIDKFLEKSLNEKEFTDLYKTNKNDINKEKEKETKNNNININNNEKNKTLKKDDNKKSNLELLLNLGGDEEEDEELEEDEEQEEEDNITKDNLKEDKEDSFLQQMLKREKEIEELRKQKEKDIENVLNKNDNLKKLIDINTIKYDKEENEPESTIDPSQNFKHIELLKEKKEYLKKKLKELQEYKDEVKIIYQDKKDELEKEKKEKQNTFNNKLKEEINNNKKKLEKQFKEKLEMYEKQLINKKNKEEKRFKDEMIKNMKSKKEEDKEIIKKKEEKEKEALKKKKEELLKEIENLKKAKSINESNLSQKKLNMQKQLLLFEEKKNIEKNNKVKNNGLEIKNYELKLEKEFQEYKQKLSKNIDMSQFSPPRQLIHNIDDNFKSNLLDDIQKALDVEFEITCKAFKQELETKKLKDIDKYLDVMNNDKQEQLIFYKSEITSFEKDYYKSIANIRTNYKNTKTNNENNLKLKFEQTLNGYEQTKQIILEQNKELMKCINDNLHKLIIGNYTLKQTETKLEEFLINLKDTYLIVYQKNKNNFEMYENEYLFKTQFIKYLLDIINYMTKLFSNYKTKNNTDNNNNKCIDNNTTMNMNMNINEKENPEQNLAENLLIFCNDKINEYKKRYKKVKNSSIFSFLNGNLMKSQSFDNINMSQFDDINKTILFDATSKRRNMKNDGYKDYKEYKEYKEYNDNKDKDKNKNNKIININSKNEENKEITSKSDNNNNNNLELTYYVVEQDNNFIIPMIPNNVLQNLNEDILILYSNITLFLKDEYNKIIKIMQMEKENNNKKNININLNIKILDKIKTFTEEEFNYLLLNYQKSDQLLNIKKKLRMILNNINEYKNNLSLDKYILKSKSSNNIYEDEIDIVNHYMPMTMTNQNLLKDNLYINNYINKNQDTNINISSKHNLGSKKYASVSDMVKEKEEQKEMIDEANLSKSIKRNYNINNLTGTFNNFYRQYNPNSLADAITNPFIYQFFNYKKTKYELDKSLGKVSMP